MNRTKATQKKLGVQLFVSHDKGKSFTVVDGFFYGKFQAEQYRERNYPNLPYRIQGLRLSLGFTPLEEAGSKKVSGQDVKVVRKKSAA